MSRHKLDMKPGFTGCWAVVGWDRPLNTFFVQVFRDGGKEDDEEILWEGTSFQEIETIETARVLLLPYADIPPEISRQLMIDKMGNPHT